MAEPIHPAAIEHLPFFISSHDGVDWLMKIMGVFMLTAVLSIGLLYLKLHALPEHMAHRSQKVQLQFVAVLALLALFTHNNALWIAALLIAMIDFPDFSTPLASISRSLERIADRAPQDPPAAAAPADERA